MDRPGTLPPTARTGTYGVIGLRFDRMARNAESGVTTDTGALRNLVAAGPSQVGIVGALRARDVSRPADDDVRKALAKPAPSARLVPRHDDLPRP